MIKSFSWLFSLYKARVLEACFCLAVAYLGIKILPFHILAKKLGTFNQPSNPRSNPNTERICRQVTQAVRTADRRVPWKNTCLMQSIAAKIMLRSRNIPSNLYLGLAKTNDCTNPLAAHAWLQCGDAIIAGNLKKDAKKFTKIAVFGEKTP